MGNLYKEIAIVINSWVYKNALVLHSSVERREIRTIYISSASGETFQIWIDPPDGGANQRSVHRGPT